MILQQQAFGRLPDGRKAELAILSNDNGMQVTITNYGGIVTALSVPDRDGIPGDVVLGFDGLEGYLGEHPYFGAIIGRFANRIGRGEFLLDGIRYRLTRNHQGHHLHGGLKGFDKVLWSAEPVEAPDHVGVRLSYLSRDGEEGYPGTMSVTVEYRLLRANVLEIRYEATTDRPTIVNLTHHSYFNLAGGGTVLAHELTVQADRYAVVDEALIPTGEVRVVEGTVMDFRKPCAVGERIARVPGGYDHYYLLTGDSIGMVFAARCHDPNSGRTMEVWTTEPGVQVYSGNFLDGTITGRRGRIYARHAGLCLETQRFPDAPNHPGFPSAVLRPGDRYVHRTQYRFSTEA